MTDKHFTLDVDPEGLRSTAVRVGELRQHLRDKGTLAYDMPETIGEGWTGDAALYVQGEMKSLGLLMQYRMAGRLEPVPEALRTLAGQFDDALAELPSLNRRWDESETTYDEAVTAADRSREEARDDATEAGRTNQFYRNEIDDARTDAVSTASSAKATAQAALETEYDGLVSTLQQQVGTLSTVLHEACPIDVSQDQIEEFRAGQGPEIDRSDLLLPLSLTRQREEQLIAEELEAQREAAREDAREDIADLNDALEDGDTEDITEAMDAIGDRSDDEMYSEAMIRELGPEGVQDLYVQIDQSLKDDTLFIEEHWPAIEGFNDTVAGGISALPDEDMAPFVETFMNEDYGAKMWALIAASDNADGRVNAIALSYHSEIYNAALAQPGLSENGLFPDAFPYAFGDRADMLGQFDDRSSGSDLADVLEHASDEHVEDLMLSLHQVQVDGGTMSDGEYEHVAALYGELLVELKDRHLDALGESDGARPDLLMEVLRYRHVNTDYAYTDPFAPYLYELVNDPEWALWYMNNARDGFVDASVFKDLIDESGTDVERLISDMTTYQIERGDNPEQVATNLGLLLRSGDLLGDNIQLGGVVEGIAIRLAGLAGPGYGIAAGVFGSLLDEVQRLEAEDQALDDAMDNNALQEILAFGIYTEVNGGPPPGFDEYIEAEGLGDDERAVNLYIQHLEETGGPEWEELQNLITLIDESRDEE